jgi:hypothetical protein
MRYEHGLGGSVSTPSLTATEQQLDSQPSVVFKEVIKNKCSVGGIVVSIAAFQEQMHSNPSNTIL